MPLDVWYEKGLKFGCTGCGQCCTGSPGYVWLTDKDIKTFTDHLQISREEFLKTYCRQVHGRISLLEDPNNYDCIFLKGERCTAYGARPRQCRTFPFWKDNMRSPTAWQIARRSCEGVDNPEGKHYTRSEIDAYLKDE